MREQPLDPYPYDGTEDEMSDWTIELAKRVEWWQHTLCLLALASVRIDHISVVDVPRGNPEAIAGVWNSTTYDSCHFEFHSEKFTELSPKEQDEVIVHEWLHVVFRDFERSIKLVEDQLSPQLHTVWEEAMDDAEETLIDRLARLIVALK